jgi:hypothetical protein
MFGTMESENLTEFPVESGRRVSQPVVLFDRSLSKDEDKMRVLGMCYRKHQKRGSFFWFTVEFASVPHIVNYLLYLYCSSDKTTGIAFFKLFCVHSLQDTGTVLTDISNFF